MDTQASDIKITITPKNKGNLLANATVSIFTLPFGFITIKNFQIWVSQHFNERLQEKINIIPPSVHAYGRYIPIVFFEDKKLWEELERLIYSEFSSKAKGCGEDVDVDSIPI